MSIFVLTDLGYGDSGKGTTTHWLCHTYPIHTVIRTGGPQAAHNVVTASGQYHMFSQFGAGTLVGTKTTLSKHMVIDPYAILNEGRGLIEMGVTNPFNLMTIHEDCLVITPFQAAANRLAEIARGKNRHGTVGMGVGETVLDSEILGDAVIRVKDFGQPWLSDKLEAIRQRKLQQMAPIIDQLPTLPEKARKEVLTLRNQQIVRWATQEFNYLINLVDIVDDHYLHLLLKQGWVVVEPSQGVLLDRWYGFHPHTTKVRTTNEDALSLIAELGFSDQVVRLGILRAYQTRHGAGPFVTEDSSLSQSIPDLHNVEHEWQEHFRVGFLDAVAMRYALAASGGKDSYDGLVVTCLDRMAEVQVWPICHRYNSPQQSCLQNYFLTEQDQILDIRVRPNTMDADHLAHQERLEQVLRTCSPVMQTALVNTDRQSEMEAHRVYLNWIEHYLQVPVGIISLGPTEKDKICLPSFQRLFSY